MLVKAPLLVESILAKVLLGYGEIQYLWNRMTHSQVPYFSAGPIDFFFLFYSYTQQRFNRNKKNRLLTSNVTQIKLQVFLLTYCVTQMFFKFN